MHTDNNAINLQSYHFFFFLKTQVIKYSFKVVNKIWPFKLDWQLYWKNKTQITALERWWPRWSHGSKRAHCRSARGKRYETILARCSIWIFWTTILLVDRTGWPSFRIIARSQSEALISPRSGYVSLNSCAIACPSWRLKFSIALHTPTLRRR